MSPVFEVPEVDGQLKELLQKPYKPEKGPTRTSTFPQSPADRKKFPVSTGFLDYFPDAIVAVSYVSWKAGDQHHPGEPTHWDRSKSADEDDALMRHFMCRGTVDDDGIPHSYKLAWRALALLQKEIESDTCPLKIPKDTNAR